MNLPEEQEILLLLRSDLRRKMNQGLILLYDSMTDRLRAFFLKKGVSESEVEDLTQSTVVLVYRKLRSPKFELTSRLSTYVFGVAKNLTYMHLRSVRRMVDMEDLEVVDEVEDAVDYMTRLERAQALKSLLDRVGEGCKQVLMLYYFEEMSMKDIARELKYSSAQVAKNKKSSCLKKLKNLVGNNKDIL